MHMMDAYKSCDGLMHSSWNTKINQTDTIQHTFIFSFLVHLGRFWQIPRVGIENKLSEDREVAKLPSPVPLPVLQSSPS